MGTLWDETCAAGEEARKEQKREFARAEAEYQWRLSVYLRTGEWPEKPACNHLAGSGEETT